MQIMFCVGQEVAYAAVTDERGRTLREMGVTRIGLQDDQYIAGDADAITLVWPILMDQLARAGHELTVSKCHAHAPTYVGTPTAELPPSLVALFDVLRRDEEGLLMLGGTASGASEAIVGTSHISLGPVNKRAKRAVKLAARIAAFVQFQPSTTTCHEA